MARLYAHGSLGRSAAAKSVRAESLVEAGNPLLVVELETNEAPFPLILDGFDKVSREDALGANAVFGRLRVRGRVVPVWILQRGDATREQLRSLRLCLVRLHAEQEALDIVLKQIQRKRLLHPAEEEAVDVLEDYFNLKTRLINRAEWNGVRQSAILAAFDAAENVTPPASRQNLIDRYSGARRQIWKKVEEYQNRRAAVRVVSVTNIDAGGISVDKSVTINQTGTGNVANVAEFMSDVVNYVNNNVDQSSSSEEVKSLMKQLANEINAIATKVDPKQTQRMGNDLKTLSAEIAQPEPRRAWYELSLKGLREAAEALGEIAAPVVSTVTKLMPLLLGT
ncbi:MAG TPA: hypothetical protein VGQ19_01215 [Burkholderiales bacterium]|nr:hypothetical protein [Burkholderiales bacterium]